MMMMKNNENNDGHGGDDNSCDDEGEPTVAAVGEQVYTGSDNDNNNNGYNPSYYHCYCLRSLDRKHPYKNYVGFTTNPYRRLRQHNGILKHGGAWKTKRGGRPWEFVVVIGGFPTHRMALQFEWAWQHPNKSLIVRANIGDDQAKTLKRKRGTLGQMCILKTLLARCPDLYGHNHLTFHFLKEQCKQIYEKAIAMPSINVLSSTTTYISVASAKEMLSAAAIKKKSKTTKQKRQRKKAGNEEEEEQQHQVMPEENLQQEPPPIPSIKLLTSLEEMPFYATRNQTKSSRKKKTQPTTSTLPTTKRTSKTRSVAKKKSSSRKARPAADDTTTTTTKTKEMTTKQQQNRKSMGELYRRCCDFYFSDDSNSSSEDEDNKEDIRGEGGGGGRKERQRQRKATETIQTSFDAYGYGNASSSSSSISSSSSSSSSSESGSGSEKGSGDEDISILTSSMKDINVSSSSSSDEEKDWDELLNSSYSCQISKDREKLEDWDSNEYQSDDDGVVILGTFSKKHNNDSSSIKEAELTQKESTTKIEKKIDHDDVQTQISMVVSINDNNGYYMYNNNNDGNDGLASDDSSIEIVVTSPVDKEKKIARTNCCLLKDLPDNSYSSLVDLTPSIEKEKITVASSTTAKNRPHLDNDLSDDSSISSIASSSRIIDKKNILTKSAMSCSHPVEYLLSNDNTGSSIDFMTSLLVEKENAVISNIKRPPSKYTTNTYCALGINVTTRRRQKTRIREPYRNTSTTSPIAAPECDGGVICINTDDDDDSSNNILDPPLSMKALLLKSVISPSTGRATKTKRMSIVDLCSP